MSRHRPALLLCTLLWTDFYALPIVNAGPFPVFYTEVKVEFCGEPDWQGPRVLISTRPFERRVGPDGAEVRQYRVGEIWHAVRAIPIRMVPVVDPTEPPQ